MDLPRWKVWAGSHRAPSEGTEGMTNAYSRVRRLLRSWRSLVALFLAMWGLGTVGELFAPHRQTSLWGAVMIGFGEALAVAAFLLWLAYRRVRRKLREGD